MLLKLLQVGEPVLRDRAQPLTHEEVASDSIRELIASMHESLRAAPGVGLAVRLALRPVLYRRSLVANAAPLV